MEGRGSINATDAPGGGVGGAAAPVTSGSSFSFLNDDDFFDSSVPPEPQPPAVQQQSHHSTSENEQPPHWQQQQPAQQQYPPQQQQQQPQQFPSPQQSPGAESFVSLSPAPPSHPEPRSAAPHPTATSPHSHPHTYTLSPAQAQQRASQSSQPGPLLEMPWPESPAASPGAAQRHSPGVPAAAAAPLPTYSPFPVLDQQPGSSGAPGGAYPAASPVQQQQPSQQQRSLQQQQQQQHHSQSVSLDEDGWQQWPAAIAGGPVTGSAPAPRPVSPVAPSVPFRTQPPPVSPTVAALPPHNPYAERPASAAQQQQQQPRPQAYQQYPQQPQQQQPLSHSHSQGAFPGAAHSRNQSGSAQPQPQAQQNSQQSPSPNVPVGLPVQPGSAEIICPYCQVRLRFPMGAELVRCGSCNSISRLPPQMQVSPPQPQQVGQQQQLVPQSGASPLPLQAGMQPLPQPMMAAQGPATRVRFQCSGCAQWLATDVGPDGSAVARCPSCQTLMRPMMTLAPPPQQLTHAQLQAFQRQQQQQRPQQMSGPQMQFPGNAHVLANPAMLPSQQQQQQQQPQAPPQSMTVLQQQEYLLAQAAANKAARERQQQGQAQQSQYAQGPPLPTQRVLSAGSSYVGLAQAPADPRYQQQQLQRPQSVRRPSGDYSGMGSANFSHANGGPQQRFAPAPRPSPSLQPSLSEDFVDAPYTPMSGAPSMASGGLGSQMAALHHGHNAAPPMSFSAQQSQSQSRPQWSEGKEESEAQVAADAEFARQMAERLNALSVSDRVDSEGAPIDHAAGRSQAARRVRAAANDDKALPLLANPL